MGAPEQEASDSACDRSRPLPSTDCAPQASPSHHHHLLLLQACEAYQALLAQGLVRTADGPRAGSAAAVPPQPSVDVRARRSPVPIGRHLASPQCPCPPRLRPRSPPPCRRRRWLWWRRSDERQAPLGSHARGSYAKHLARTSASKHACQSACLPRSLLACICASTRMMQVCWHAGPATGMAAWTQSSFGACMLWCGLVYVQHFSSLGRALLSFQELGAASVHR